MAWANKGFISAGAALAKLSARIRGPGADASDARPWRAASMASASWPASRRMRPTDVHAVAAVLLCFKAKVRAFSTVSAAIFLSGTLAKMRGTEAMASFCSAAGSSRIETLRACPASSTLFKASKICSLYRLASAASGMAFFQAWTACKADSPERDCKARSTARWNSAGSRVLRAASKMKENPLPGEPLRTFNSPNSNW